MSQSSGPSGTMFYDPRARMYYRYDARTDCYIYEDGRRVRRPQNASRPREPRSPLQPPPSRTQPEPSYFDDSPSGTKNEYTLSNSPQSASQPSLNAGAFRGVYQQQQQQQHQSRGSPGASPPWNATSSDVASVDEALGRMVIGSALSPSVNPQARTPAATPARAARSPTQRGLPGPLPGQVSHSQGIRIVRVQNSGNAVQTIIGTEPPQLITDPVLYQSGVRARRALYGTGDREGESERLWADFKIRRHTFFKCGRVFLVLWVEPAGETTTLITSTARADPIDPAVTQGRFGEAVFSKVRRFVVIRESNKFCSALPIASYGKKGVGKEGTTKSDHGIIYTGSEAPEPQPDELPRRGEEPMRQRPIRVVADNETDKLDPMSRIDFAKVHTVQHNLKVKPFGYVHPRSMDALLSQFHNVWGNSDEPAIASSSRRDWESVAPASVRTVSEGGRRGSQAGHSVTSGSSDRRRRSARNEAPEAEDESDSDNGGRRGEDMRAASGVEHNRPRVQQAESETQQAQQAQHLRAALRRIVDQGYTREEAYEAVIRQFIAQGYTREGAVEEVQTRLRFGRSMASSASAHSGPNETSVDSDDDSGNSVGSDRD